MVGRRSKSLHHRRIGIRRRRLRRRDRQFSTWIIGVAVVWGGIGSLGDLVLLRTTSMVWVGVLFDAIRGLTPRLYPHDQAE